VALHTAHGYIVHVEDMEHMQRHLAHGYIVHVEDMEHMQRHLAHGYIVHVEDMEHMRRHSHIVKCYVVLVYLVKAKQ
jgi:chromosomal replication initiation ATPase DnaA